jgi:hypothetical protein
MNNRQKYIDKLAQIVSGGEPTSMGVAWHCGSALPE